MDEERGYVEMFSVIINKEYVEVADEDGPIVRVLMEGASVEDVYLTLLGGYGKELVKVIEFARQLKERGF